MSRNEGKNRPLLCDCQRCRFCMWHLRQTVFVLKLSPPPPHPLPQVAQSNRQAARPFLPLGAQRSRRLSQQRKAAATRRSLFLTQTKRPSNDKITLSPLPFFSRLFLPKVADMSPLRHLPHLFSINVAHNTINGIEQVSVLRNFQHLCNLNLNTNPIQVTLTRLAEKLL